jgi:hypothetical protein
MLLRKKIICNPKIYCTRDPSCSRLKPGERRPVQRIVHVTRAAAPALASRVTCSLLEQMYISFCYSLQWFVFRDTVGCRARAAGSASRYGRENQAVHMGSILVSCILTMRGGRCLTRLFKYQSTKVGPQAHPRRSQTRLMGSTRSGKTPIS